MDIYHQGNGRMILMSELKKKSKFDLTMILKIVCVVMMVAFMVCQFLPFWTYETYTEENMKNHIIYDEPLVPIVGEVSLGEYVWRADKHDLMFGEYDEGMKNFNGDDLNQNDIVMMPFLVTLLIAFGLIFMLLSKKSAWPGLFTLVGGIYAIRKYLEDPADMYKIGETYNLHVAASIGLAVASLALVVVWLINVVKWFTVKKRHY